MRSLLAYGAGPLLGLVTAPILARALGPEGRGELAVVLMVLTVAGPIASLGMPAAVSVFVGRGSDPSSTYRTGLRASTPTAVVVYLALCGYAFYVSTQTMISAYFLASTWAVVLVTNMVQNRRAMWQGAAAFGRLDQERFAFAIVRAASVAALALLGISTFEPFVVASLGAFLVAAILLWYPRGTVDTSAARLQPGPTARELRAFSRRAAVGTVAAAANNRLDQVILPALISLSSLGLYSVAVTVAEVPLIAGTVAGRNYLQASAAGAKGRRLLLAGAIPAIAGIAACGVLAALTPWLLPAVFGPSFADATAPTLVLLGASACGIGAICLAAVLTGRSRPLAASLLSFLSVAIVVVLFVLLASDMSPTVAATIAAAAQGAGLVVGLGVLAADYRRQRSRSPMANSQPVEDHQVGP